MCNYPLFIRVTLSYLEHWTNIVDSEPLLANMVRSVRQGKLTDFMLPDFYKAFDKLNQCKFKLWICVVLGSRRHRSRVVRAVILQKVAGRS